MPRRNQRAADNRPLDLTPPPVSTPRPKPLQRGESAFEARIAREAEAAERQRQARIKGGIDWSTCLVPGCGEPLRTLFGPTFKRPEDRDPTAVLPLCIEHALIAWQQVQASKHEPLIIETNAMLIQRTEAEAAKRAEEAKKRRIKSLDGHIYFVRLNGLVKVGWSRDVDERLRAYGPQVEVLCIYPGSRMDETTLHRQLRPALARGREWYEDGKIIADFVADALKRHGEPTFFDSWTKPKEVIKPKRWSA